MSKIERTKERIKQTGEVFTPLPLVDEILSKLDDSVWSPEKTFIDPSCGDGNFLVRVIAWKMWKESTAKQALSTTYGVELMEDNANHARQRLLTNAFAASNWYKQSDQLFPHMTYEEEYAISDDPQYKKFVKKYKTIVDKNVVCHDALTYDYNFGETTEQNSLESLFVY